MPTVESKDETIVDPRKHVYALVERMMGPVSEDSDDDFNPIFSKTSRPNSPTVSIT
jgi:hypothetical protein